LGIIPLIGSTLASYLFCCLDLIITRLFILHWIVGLIIALLVLLHLIMLHYSLSNHYNCINSISSLLFNMHSLIWKDCSAIIAWLLIAGLLLMLNPDYTGNVLNLIKPNIASTPINILPEWYLLMFYCWLRMVPIKALGLINVLNLLILMLSSIKIFLYWWIIISSLRWIED
jgi:quinol-cytochrome oxidoreductase complex cytochrome b subunit